MCLTRSRDSARRIVSTMSSSMPQMPRRKRDVMHLDRARYLEQSFVVMRDELEKSLAAQQNSLRIAYEMVAEMRRWKEYLEYQSRNPARVTFTLDPRTPRHEEPNRNRPMDYGGSNQQSLCHLGPGPNFRNDSSMRAKDASDVWYADSSIQFPSRNGEPR